MVDNNYNYIPCGIYITTDIHTKEKWDELVEHLKINRFFINKDLDIFKHFIS